MQSYKIYLIYANVLQTKCKHMIIFNILQQLDVYCNNRESKKINVGI